ncbi:MAG: hypothetical protein IPL35_09265 [Sphingobacteriales bacterium]|nr:hypothetical protein [Sphingobacteriales bacterium]
MGPRADSGAAFFWKGLVQEQYDLADGGAMRLTVARYYTPSGRCIQKPYGNTPHTKERMKRNFQPHFEWRTLRARQYQIQRFLAIYHCRRKSDLWRRRHYS